MKRFFILLLTLLFCISGVSCAKDDRFAIPQYEDDVRMMIGACFGPPKEFATQERYDEVAECGCNLVDAGGTIGVNGYTVEEALACLDMIKNAGIYGLVDDYQIKYYNITNWRADCDTYFPQYKDHPAYFGNHLCDEPSPGQMEPLGTVYKTFKEHAPDKRGFINLYPSGAASVTANGAYENYINEYLDTVNPDHLSYDHYPLITNVWEDDQIDVRNTYFKDMEVQRYAAKEKGIPLHNYILSVKHLSYPILSEQAIRWQVAVNFAFGLSSYTYFTYWVPPVAGYSDALINPDGTRTPQYEFAKKVNREVLAWDHVYLRYEWQNTYAVPGADPWFGLSVLEHKASEGIAGISKISAAEDALCGAFEDSNGNRGYMLTNAANPYDEKTCTVTLNFDKEYRGAQIFEKGVPRIVTLGKNGETTVSLEPGEGKFIIPLKRG